MGKTFDVGYFPHTAYHDGMDQRRAVVDFLSLPFIFGEVGVGALSSSSGHMHLGLQPLWSVLTFPFGRCVVSML